MGISGWHPTNRSRYTSCMVSMHVAIVDVETNGSGEREAMSLLESRVLEHPEQSGAAWSTLVQLTAELSQWRSGVDEAQLRATLEKAGTQLKAPARYEKDIAKLRNQANETLRYLDHHSRIPVGETQVRVNRRATDAIRTASESNSLVVVGWPGAGNLAYSMILSNPDWMKVATWFSSPLTRSVRQALASCAVR